MLNLSPNRTPTHSNATQAQSSRMENQSATQLPWIDLQFGKRSTLKGARGGRKPLPGPVCVVFQTAFVGCFCFSEFLFSSTCPHNWYVCMHGCQITMTKQKPKIRKTRNIDDDHYTGWLCLRLGHQSHVVVALNGLSRMIAGKGATDRCDCN